MRFTPTLMSCLRNTIMSCRIEVFRRSPSPYPDYVQVELNVEPRYNCVSGLLNRHEQDVMQFLSNVYLHV
jgi:hypothetical protein